MKYTVLASGSKGNCTYLETENAKLVIDCGSTKRYLTQAFNELNIELSDLDALLITHDHSDHISQLRMFRHLPVYSSTALKGREDVKVLNAYETFTFKDLSIFPLVLSHDCDVIYGYVIKDRHSSLVYITDTGYIKEQDLRHIRNADYYIIESNHDVELLMKSNRPHHTKMRIVSDSGHLSNEYCGYVLSKVIGDKTQEIVLAHLSEEANTEEFALNSVKNALNDSHKLYNHLKICCAKQHSWIKGGEQNEETFDHSCVLAFGTVE